MASRMAVDRETLYAQVWAEPMTKVAARYGVSSSFLARVCERLDVPRPIRGHWARLEVGKAVAKPGLPKPRPGIALAWTRAGDPRVIARALPTPPSELSATPVTARRAHSKQHPLIDGAHEHFEGVRESEGGYLRPTKRRLVDVFVTKGTLDRALKLANQLFGALGNRGYPVALAGFDQHLQRPELDERINRKSARYEHGRWRPDRPSVVYIGTVAIGLTLFELSEKVEVEYVDGKFIPVAQGPLTRRRGLRSRDAWTHTRDMPSGTLCLRASSPYARASWEMEWREANRGTLAAQFPAIVQGLESGAVAISKLVQDGERRAEIERQEWQLQHEKWQRQEAERRHAQHVKEGREQLAEIIQAWGIAKQVEGFFEDAERRAAALDDADRERLIDRLQRARSLHGGVDALQRFLKWKAPDER